MKKIPILCAALFGLGASTSAQQELVDASWLMPPLGPLPYYGLTCCSTPATGSPNPVIAWDDSAPCVPPVGCPPVPPPQINYMTLVQPQSEGDYLSADVKNWAPEQIPANKGYRFIVETDAREIYWYIVGQSPHPQGLDSDRPSEDFLPHPMGYFVHEQNDRHFGSKHLSDADAVTMVNGDGPSPDTKTHEIEFVPTSPGDVGIFCLAWDDTVSPPHFYEIGFFISVIEVEIDIAEEAWAEFPELSGKSTYSEPNPTKMKVPHIFVPQGSSDPIPVTVKMTFPELNMQTPQFETDYFLATAGDGLAYFQYAAFGSGSDYTIGNFSFTNHIAYTVPADDGLPGFNEMKHEQRLGIVGLEASSRPASVFLDVQINRDYSFGTEDGSYQTLYGVFPNDEKANTEDRDHGEPQNARLDSLDLDVSGVIDPDEANPNLNYTEDNPNLGMLTFLDQEDMDFSGGDHDDGGDLQAVQSAVVGITVIRGELQTREWGGGDVLPYWERVEEPGARVASNLNDDDYDGVVDWDGAGSDPDLEPIAILTHPSYEKLDLVGVEFEGEATFLMDGYDLKVWRDADRSELLTGTFFDLSENGVNGVMNAWAEMRAPESEVNARVLIGYEYAPGAFSTSNAIPGEGMGEEALFTSYGIRIIKVPQYVFGSATFATPVKFEVVGFDTPFLNSLGVSVVDDSGYLVGGVLGDRFVADGGEEQDNGSSSKYTALVPASMYQSLDLPTGASASSWFNVHVNFSEDDGDEASFQTTTLLPEQELNGAGGSYICDEPMPQDCVSSRRPVFLVSPKIIAVDLWPNVPPAPWVDVRMDQRPHDAMKVNGFTSKGVQYPRQTFHHYEDPGDIHGPNPHDHHDDYDVIYPFMGGLGAGFTDVEQFVRQETLSGSNERLRVRNSFSDVSTAGNGNDGQGFQSRILGVRRGGFFYTSYGGEPKNPISEHAMDLHQADGRLDVQGFAGASATVEAYTSFSIVDPNPPSTLGIAADVFGLAAALALLATPPGAFTGFVFLSGTAAGRLRAALGTLAIIFNTAEQVMLNAAGGDNDPTGYACARVLRIHMTSEHDPNEPLPTGDYWNEFGIVIPDTGWSDEKYVAARTQGDAEDDQMSLATFSQGGLPCQVGQQHAFYIELNSMCSATSKIPGGTDVQVYAEAILNVTDPDHWRFFSVRGRDN